MATMPTQTILPAGLTPVMTPASASGDQFEPSVQTVLMLANGSSTPIEVTVLVTATAYGQPVDDVTLTVPAGGQLLAGPFDPGEVAQPATGLAQLSYASTAGLSVAVLAL